MKPSPLRSFTRSTRQSAPGSFRTLSSAVNIVRTDIDEVYKSISKTEVISESKLIEFLNSKQRDARLNQMLYPEYDAKRVSGPGGSLLICQILGLVETSKHSKNQSGM